MRRFAFLTPVLIVLASVLALSPTTRSAAQASVTYIQLILDASGSMYGKLPAGGTRISAAKDVLSSFINRLPNDPSLNVGLRIYGANTAAGSAEACTDSKLVLPMKGLGRTGSGVRAVNAQSDIQARIVRQTVDEAREHVLGGTDARAASGQLAVHAARGVQDQLDVRDRSLRRRSSRWRQGEHGYKHDQYGCQKRESPHENLRGWDEMTCSRNLNDSVYFRF